MNSKVIRIDGEVWESLKDISVMLDVSPFRGPNDVLRRILYLDDTPDTEGFRGDPWRQ